MTAAEVPPTAPTAERVRRLFGTPRRKLAAWAIASALLVGAGAMFLAMRAGEPPASTKVDDVPRRDGNAIIVSSTFREVARLETKPASLARLVPVMQAVGTVAFDPTRVAAVGTRAAGVVAKVLRVEGDFVQEGDLLAEIESAGLVEAHADLRVANSKKRAAALNLARVQGLFDRQLATGPQFEEAKSMVEQQQALVTAAKERIEALGGGHSGDTGISQLRAPVSGVVAERAIAPGQNLGPGHVAFRVGDLAQLWVRLQVFERDIGFVSVGDQVEVRSLAELGRTISGSVAHVGSVLDPATGTIGVRVVVPNQDQALRPGQSVRARIRTSARSRTAISVPASAVTYVDGAPTVFVAEAPTRFVPRKVVLGIDAGDHMEVTKGIREGELVVSKNVLAIKSEIFR